MDKTKRDLIEFINALEIPGLIVEDLHLFKGDFVNLEYVLDNGSKFKLLKDEDDYYGVQVETDTCVCYGVAINDHEVVVSTYQENGTNAKIIYYKSFD
jgi:hypothetical protein